MSQQQTISEICDDVRINSVKPDPDPNHSLSEIAKEITLIKSKKSLDDINNETNKLKKRIDLVNKLNKLKREINAAKKDGAFDAKNNAELLQLLDEVRELDLNLENEEGGAKETIPGIKADKTKYTKEETDNLVTALSTTIEDLNTQNQMQTQTINRYWQFYTEIYSMAKEIQKTDHDMMRKPTQGIGAR